MTTQKDILAGLRALVATALPGAELRGFTEPAAKPERVGPNGSVIGDPGDPGPPEYEMSPLAYTYNHHITVEVLVPPSSGDAELFTMLAAIGAAVVADRTLGGLVTFLDTTAPVIADDDITGTVTLRFATFDFVAEYTLSNPLSA